MDAVKFEPHVAKNCKTGKPVNLGQYRVFMGDRQVGILRDAPGSIFCPIVKNLTTLEQNAIGNAAQKELGWRCSMGRIENLEATERGRKEAAEREAMEDEDDDDDE